MKNILQHTITKDCYKNKINNQIEIDELKSEMVKKYEYGDYSFENKIEYNLYTQKNKKRKIAEIKNENSNLYTNRSLEYFLSVSLNKLVVNKTKLKFGNRNKIILGLFNILKALDKFQDYTIIKFDFKNFFDSISYKYVYNKYLDNIDFTKEQKSCLKKYISSIKYCTAGLPLSNTFAEIIGQDFDVKVKQAFHGIIYYARYVDDGILVLNNKLMECDVKSKLNQAMDNVFYDKAYFENTFNKTKIDYDKKFSYITREGDNNTFDYLGYLIKLEDMQGGRLRVTLGIAKQKQEKYKNKTKNIIREFKSTPEKMRLVLKLFSRRVVYTILKNNDVKRWISKGIIYNYKDLFFFGEDIDHDTKIFLDSLYNKCFSELGLKVPYYLKDSKCNRGYNLLYCLKQNKTFILDKNIGIKDEDLDNLLKIVSPEYDFNNRKYHEKVKQLLIECKIGY